MSLNKVSAEIPQEKEAEVIGQLKSISESLSFLINLTSKERIRLVKLSRGRVDFVDSALVHIRSNPEYLPVYVPLQEFEKDVTLAKSISRIQAEIDSLKDKLNDTALLAESDAYQYARLFYKSVKAASKEGAENAERIAKDLGYHYKKVANSKVNGGSEEANSSKQ